MARGPPVGSLADDAEAGQLDSLTVQRSLKRVFSFRLVKVRRCLAGDGQGSGGAPGGVINPNAEVEREARLALNFGDRAKFPQGLSAEVEAFLHVRDLRLLGRVDQSALMQEAFDEGTNLVFQEFTGSSGDEEVVRVAQQVDFRVPQDLGALPRPLAGKRALQQLLQPIEREICELSARGLRLAVFRLPSRLPSRTKSDPQRIELVPCNWPPPTSPVTTA